MRAYAIVIGIDRYANPAWGLDAAGADAIAFARWACERGGVTPDDLCLLLSTDKPPPDLEFKHGQADSTSISQAIIDVQNGAAGDADRLYFYYAGHGLSAPGVLSGGDQEPVLIPSDVKALAADSGRLIGFSRILPALSTSKPPLQFFFLDACRDFGLHDFQRGLGGAVGAWMPPASEDGALSAQLGLYATAPGKRAHEQKALGQGVFSGSLVDGLRGSAAASWNSIDECYEIRFHKLAKYVKAAVRTKIIRAVGADWQHYVQLPERIVLRAEDEALVTMAEHELEPLPLKVRVAPKVARDTCRLTLGLSAPGGHGAEAVLVEGPAPPVDREVELLIRPGDYLLRAEATKYRRYRKACAVWAPTVVDLDLEDAVDGEDDVDDGAGEGAIDATCDDPSVLIAIFDSDGKPRGSGTCRVHAEDLPEGVYLVRMVTAAGQPVEERTEVLPGRTTTLQLTAPALDRTLGVAQRQMLESLEVTPDVRGYVRPADELEPIAAPPLASLLGLAAFAAHTPHRPGLERLERFGVRGRRSLKKGAGLLVIVGASGDHPAPGVTREEFCEGSRIVVRDLEGFLLRSQDMRVLRHLPAAAQATLDLAPGCVMIELRVPGLAPTRYAVTALPGRVSVLIAVAEDSGDVDVQQYLLPVGADLPDGEALGPREMRRLDLAQRRYLRRARVSAGAGERALGVDADLSELLSGRWRDPLMGALAGYMLLHRGTPEQFAGSGALDNMLRHFGGLPDSHVLAALAEPSRRDEHFGRAMELGLPMFTEGFRALYDWHRATHEGREWPMLLEPSALLPASSWTAWIAERPVLAVRDGGFGAPPAGWPMLEDRRAAIEAALPAVGRLSRASDAAVSSTTFAVAPGLVLAMEFALPDGRADGLVVDFGEDPTNAPNPFSVTGVERVVKRPEHQSVVLLRTSERAADGTPFPAPLALAGEPPRALERRRVYVAGYPVADRAVARELGIEAAFAGRADVKRLQPGQVLGLDHEGVILRHDCLTLKGNGGSPLVDLETGCVLGVHYASRWSQYKRGDAVPAWSVSAAVRG